jgi:hypothetical protein
VEKVAVVRIPIAIPKAIQPVVEGAKAGSRRRRIQPRRSTITLLTKRALIGEDLLFPE